MAQSTGQSVLYVASRLPELSETFVYREMLGLRARGRTVLGASIRPPRPIAGDPALATFVGVVFIVYAPATMLRLPLALIRHPVLLVRAIRDAATADHPTLISRLKHVYQAAMGIGAGWRLRHRGIGHVHAHMANVPAMVGLYIAKTLGARFSFTGHAADLFVQRAGLAFKLEQAAFVACISNWHHDFYGRVTPMDGVRRPVIRCSVALPGNIRAEGQEIVTVARLVPKKGVDILLRAFALADCEGWRLRILGDGQERARLEQLTQDLKIDDRVVFEGARPHAACLTAIGGCGLFVLPCRTAADGDMDGIPVVLMEAMAAARAVIAGDLPTIRELVEDGACGRLVPAEDVGLLAAALSELVNDPPRRAALGLAARRRIAEEFSDAVNLDRLSVAFDHAEATAAVRT